MAERSGVGAKGQSAMYFVYVLTSRDTGKTYVGSSATPEERLLAHNAGRGGWTRSHRPWTRVLLEEHPDRDTAERRERYLKSGWGGRWLAKRLPECGQTGAGDASPSRDSRLGV